MPLNLLVVRLLDCSTARLLDLRRLEDLLTKVLLLAHLLDHLLQDLLQLDRLQLAHPLFMRLPLVRLLIEFEKIRPELTTLLREKSTRCPGLRSALRKPAYRRDFATVLEAGDDSRNFELLCTNFPPHEFAISEPKATRCPALRCCESRCSDFEFEYSDFGSRRFEFRFLSGIEKGEGNATASAVAGGAVF